jgi:hypothetical protein
MRSRILCIVDTKDYVFSKIYQHKLHKAYERDVTHIIRESALRHQAELERVGKRKFSHRMYEHWSIN